MLAPPLSPLYRLGADQVKPVVVADVDAVFRCEAAAAAAPNLEVAVAALLLPPPTAAAGETVAAAAAAFPVFPCLVTRTRAALVAVVAPLPILASAPAGGDD